MSNPVTLSALYVDFNSYFASVEQQERPELRDKPVAVIPADTDATCAIAASYEAKAFGVSTGTRIYEARKQCPELICVKARHDVYVDYHHRLLKEIERHVPIEQVRSIDECVCRLTGLQCKKSEAVGVAYAIKAGIYNNIGNYIRCSIGISATRLLAKIACELHKPDGLTVLLPDDIITLLGDAPATVIPGIAKGMKHRLARAGIFTVGDIMRCDRSRFRAAWGSVDGERYWHMLHGTEIKERKSERKSISHSRILEPSLRHHETARIVFRELVIKAGSRLRDYNMRCGFLSVGVRVEKGRAISVECTLDRVSDHPTLLSCADSLWNAIITNLPPDIRFKKVFVILSRLTAKENIQPCLPFHDEITHTQYRRKNEALSEALDHLNKKFGKGTVAPGAVHRVRDEALKNFTGMKIAFNRIPDHSEYE